MRNLPTERLAILAALTTVVLWASAFVGIRAVAEDLSPGSLALGRLGIGAIALGVLNATRPWTRPSRRELALIAASGLLWFAFYNVALNEAERVVDAATASMLVNMGPIFIAILAGLFLGEGVPARLFAGLAVAFAGTVIIGVASAAPNEDSGGNAAMGVVLCLAAALAYAGGVTLQKPAVRRVPAIQVTWLACVVGAVACIPFAPGLARELGEADLASVAWLGYLGLFPTAVAFTTWAFALRHTAAGRLGSTTYLVPPIVIVMAWFLLGEVPPALALVGGVLCIGGVVVARSTRRRWAIWPRPRADEVAGG